MKKKNNSWTTVLLVIILIAGLSLLLYPTIADYWNSFHQSRAISSYTEEISHIDNEKYDAMIEEAREFNEKLRPRSNPYLLSDEQMEEYTHLLEVTATGIMGYIEIPEINCSLPIYHGTSEAVLQVAVGHLEWSSLPVGGDGTHSVLSGHRGLPSAKLFTDLDKLMEGDLFILRILDEILTYEVDQILIVEPSDTSNMLLEEGKDYCTLVTCTPYGVNSHRLLVRGHRIENLKEARKIRITADAVQIEPLLVAPIVAMPILLLLLIVLMIPSRPKYHREDDKNEEN